MYTLAETFDLENLSLVQAGPFENLDEGFDVYATQAFNAPDGRALAVSWIGCQKSLTQVMWRVGQMA